ncbi:MAG: hypothetical protein ABIG93_03090 [archaeon]|nr:hypothetical protein [Nanoarchaeota archaeon]
MKVQTSITIEEEVMSMIQDNLRDGTFRNKSHIFEFAVRKLMSGDGK